MALTEEEIPEPAIQELVLQAAQPLPLQQPVISHPMSNLEAKVTGESKSAHKSGSNSLRGAKHHVNKRVVFNKMQEHLQAVESDSTVELTDVERKEVDSHLDFAEYKAQVTAWRRENSKKNKTASSTKQTRPTFASRRRESDHGTTLTSQLGPTKMNVSMKLDQFHSEKTDEFRDMPFLKKPAEPLWIFYEKEAMISGRLFPDAKFITVESQAKTCSMNEVGPGTLVLEKVISVEEFENEILSEVSKIASCEVTTAAGFFFADLNRDKLAEIASCKQGVFCGSPVQGLTFYLLTNSDIVPSMKALFESLLEYELSAHTFLWLIRQNTKLSTPFGKVQPRQFDPKLHSQKTVIKEIAFDDRGNGGAGVFADNNMSIRPNPLVPGNQRRQSVDLMLNLLDFGNHRTESREYFDDEGSISYMGNTRRRTRRFSRHGDFDDDFADSRPVHRRDLDKDIPSEVSSICKVDFANN